jgi:chromosome segregation ATPase
MKYTDLREQANKALQGVTKLAADCELAAKVMAETGTFETGQAILKEAAAALTALAAQVAELTEELDAAQEAHIFADAARDAAEAKVARLEGAKRRIKHLPDEIEQQVETTRGFAKDSGMDRHQVDLMATCTSHFLDYARQLRAALTEGTPE